ncbi:serine/threonine protein kinase [Actinomadura graeca]|uniref:Serine/threonine protein kinase n=1 Tax=Actinomadura graeca TaxID=2750812 RepID=A0ABX8QZY4_9ACTN|nr:serine/threonine-protein kinase [Actinomadura graeca]QXJ24208.1 serine/threonine protein kinase [Actinomadura graeca]
MRTALRAGDPTSVGGYTVKERLGAGGMGTVYLGEDVTGAPVAVKVVDPALLCRQDGAVPGRYRREIAALRRLDRRCTAALLDADPDADPAYLVIEYVDGPSLEDTVRRDGPLRGASLEEVAVAVIAVLEHLHAENVTHRNLKPGTILLGPHGPRVSGYRIALPAGRYPRAADDETRRTLPYLAPELLLGECPGPAADVFAWAATVAYAASGAPPYGTGHWTVQHRTEPGGPLLDGLAPPLLDAVRRGLARDPVLRPTAAEALKSLRGLSPAVLETAASGVLPGGDADEWAERARRSLGEGRARLALYQAQRGLALNPLHARCLRYRAGANLAEGRPGLQDLQLAHDVEPGDAEIRRAYARELALDRGGRKTHGRAGPADAREALLTALELEPGDPVVTARYEAFAVRETGSPAVPPEVLRAVLALTAELPDPPPDAAPADLRNVPGLALDRVELALRNLAGLSLPAATRAHLASRLGGALRREARRNTGGPLRRSAAIERVAALAEFLAPGDATFARLARDAYGIPMDPRTIAAPLAGAGGVILVLAYLTLAPYWLGWMWAVPVAAVTGAALTGLLVVALSGYNAVRRRLGRALGGVSAR